MTEKHSNQVSTLGIKYPTLRDNFLKTGTRWLVGKRADDGAEGLWRIHNELYDLQDFIHQHPGGSDWLTLTKGTDITEAFETHHLTDAPEFLLGRYFVKKTTTPRNTPFTFKEDGFYKTLKRNIVQKLADLPKAPVDRSKRIVDLLLVGYISMTILAVIFKSFTCAVVSGIFLSCMAIGAHNFFHQKDNLRMYYFNFTFMDYQEWRISHALSHHLHTNTINDLEISSLEPFLWYLPVPKHKLLKYMQIIISPAFYCLIFFGSFVRGAAQILLGEKKPSPRILLPFSVLLLMITISGQIILPTIMFLFIQIVGSLHFGAVGLNAAHHHPDLFHDGDAPRSKNEMDWGLYQLDVVMDRKDITGSHFLVLTNFGDHALHHLFPTIDHGVLEYLYPVLLKTCAQFGIEWKITSQFELVKGQLQQLLKSRPRKEPPQALIALKCS